MKILRKVLVVLGAIALIIGALGGGGYSVYKYIQKQKEAQEKVRMTHSERGDLKVVLKETATLKPRKLVEIKSKVSGRVVEMCFLPGTVVKKGDVIAEIDRETYERDLEMASEELKQSKQNWDSLLPFGEIVTEPETINPREIETLIDRVLIEYGAAKVNYLNMREMYARDLISLKTLDDAEQAYDTAYVAYHHTVREASTMLTQAQVQFDQAVENLSETTIRAPVGGVLTQVLVEEGELVQGTGNMSPGTNIAEVADLSEMLAVVKLNEVDVGKVEVGDPVTLTVSSESDKKFRGEVESISPSGLAENNIVTFEVKILLHDQRPFFKPEMTANADILVDQVTDVVKVPLEAIEEKKDVKKITVLTKKAESPDASSGSAHAEGTDSDKNKEEEGDDGEEDGDFYKTDFGPKIDYEERTFEIETGMTNELWAEVIKGASEGMFVKLPSLSLDKKDFFDFH